MHGGRGHPIHERGLVEEADAVDVGGDEVVAVKHLTGDFDVDGVDVVEQTGGEEASKLEDEPGEEEDRNGAGAPQAERSVGLNEDFRHRVYLRCDQGPETSFA